MSAQFSSSRGSNRAQWCGTLRNHNGLCTNEMTVKLMIRYIYYAKQTAHVINDKS